MKSKKLAWASAIVIGIASVTLAVAAIVDRDLRTIAHSLQTRLARSDGLVRKASSGSVAIYQGDTIARVTLITGFKPDSELADSTMLFLADARSLPQPIVVNDTSFVASLRPVMDWTLPIILDIRPRTDAREAKLMGYVVFRPGDMRLRVYAQSQSSAGR